MNWGRLAGWLHGGLVAHFTDLGECRPVCQNDFQAGELVWKYCSRYVRNHRGGRVDVLNRLASRVLIHKS